MPRANRYYLPGYVWHITHRCHRQSFLLKFQRDRLVWRRWLFEARRRYGLVVLNYIVTSNHIHLLVRDRGKGEIAASMRLVAGRTAQQYNQRKGRKGAFWEGRYHATAVETGSHLARCLVYIDLNMVRAGVVRHPTDWTVSGYHDVQGPRHRYRVVDHHALADALGLDGPQRLIEAHRHWVAATLRDDRLRREPRWTEALAVGSEAFVRQVQDKLGVRGVDRRLELAEDGAYLAEEPAPYAVISGAKWPI